VDRYDARAPEFRTQALKKAAMARPIWQAQVRIGEICSQKGNEKPEAPSVLPGALWEADFCGIPYR
jgi:hypothetical protein